MIKIELKNASNGVIKTISDSLNPNESTDSIKVYEISGNQQGDPGSMLAITDLLEDVIRDLGLNVGSDFDPIQIQIIVDWGEKYEPSLEEVKLKIQDLNEEIKAWKEYKKILENADKV